MSERVSEAGVEASGPGRGREGPLTLFEYLPALTWGLRLGLPLTLAKKATGYPVGGFSSTVSRIPGVERSGGTAEIESP
jgi:hypothetical protein